MTKFQAHAHRWRDCKMCLLHKGRQQVVLARGRLPADVLFVGEAPGSSEDALGVPFVGPAGHLLDKIVKRVFEQFQVLDPNGPNYTINPLTWAFTNLVACFPREEKQAGINEPPKEAIEACAPRLHEFVVLAKPKLIVCVGALAEKWVPKALGGRLKGGMLLGSDGLPNLPCQFVAIKHPAAILRENVAIQSLSAQKCVVKIADAVEELFQ